MPVLNPIRVDPTRTVTIRKQFLSEMAKRMNQLRREIVDLIDKEDAFGLKTFSFRTTKSLVGNDGASLLSNTRWQFETSDAKLRKFQEWFEDRVDKGILKGDWTDKYIEAGYRKGLVRSYIDGKKKELSKPAGFYEGTKAQFLSSSFDAPERMSKIRLLQLRTYEQLKGVTRKMSQDMARILADGIAKGDHPSKMARRMTQEISKMTRTRANMIARTEVIHAHAEGQLDGFEELNIDKIEVMAEWLTAGADACLQCAAMEGTVMTVKEARGMIPRHPNCRCAWIPADVGEKTKGQKRTKQQVERAILKSVKAEHPKAKTKKEAFDQSRWVGADANISSRRRLQQTITRSRRRR